MPPFPRKTTVTDIRHPYYRTREPDWRKYRLTYAGGDDFIQEYLVKFSNRETRADFLRRKHMSYCPSHAKAALLDIRNAIYQRLVDVIRTGGDKTYQNAIQGKDGGVDLRGSTMNSYLGRVLMPELLSMGRVGVFIDKDPDANMTLAMQAKANIKPYLYYYQAEDILSWAYDRKNQLSSILLRDFAEEVDETTGLVSREVTTYRLMQKVPGEDLVKVTIYPETQDQKSAGNQRGPIPTTEVFLRLKKIPFVMLDIGDSLLKDIGDYQIALLNLASSDLNYAIKSNYPFYTEQFNPDFSNVFLAQSTDKSVADMPVGIGDEHCPTDDCSPQGASASVGVGEGRRYPAGLERPQFIHPSSEPLKASMEKQEQLKTEIRQLINLALTNIAPQRASADSKEKDDRGLEAGLSYIGLCLENAEREIAAIWQDYQGNRSEVVVSYPDNYSLKSDADRRAEAAELATLVPQVPSPTYQRFLAKQIARIVLGTKVSPTELREVEGEIDIAPVINVDPETIRKDVELGLVCRQTASLARLYPAGEAERAMEEKAEMAALTLAAQTSPEATENAANNLGARGVPELSADPQGEARAEKAESQSPDSNPEGIRRVRGEGQ